MPDSAYQRMSRGTGKRCWSERDSMGQARLLRKHKFPCASERSRWASPGTDVVSYGCRMRLLEYFIVRGLLAALQAIPYAVALRIAHTVAHIAFRFSDTPRERTLNNLDLAYGDSLSKGEAAKIARGVFETICRHVADLAHVTREAARGVRVENVEILKVAYAQGRGVIVVSAHFGCWIRMALIPHLAGVRAAVIMKKQRNKALLQWAIRFLKRDFDLDIIQKKNARDQAVAFLQGGGVVGFFADQHPRKGGFPARFFGREIMAAGGPAVYARRFACPLIIFTAAQQADGTHVLRFDGPVSLEGTCDEISQRWVDLLEARIREHPEQWMWMHRRWRGPAGEALV